MGRHLFFINYDQMQGYHDRKKTIEFLFKKGDVLNALLLLIVHKKLHPPYVKEKNREDFEFSKTICLDHRVPNQEVKDFAKGISNIRNPGLIENEESSIQLAKEFFQKLGEQIEEVE